MTVPAIVWDLIVMVVKWLSPTARTAFDDALKAFYKHAMETSSSLDDVAAKVICTLMNVDVSGVVYTPPAAGGSTPKEVVDTVTNGLVQVATGRDPSLDTGA